MKKLITLLLTFISFSLLAQNPQLLKDVVPGNNGGTIQKIVKTTNYTFFNENDGGAATDRSLYRTDGTPAGTIKLNLTYPGYISTKAEKLTALGDKIIFAGDNFNYYGEIWASDGTQAGTVAIERFQPINNKIPVVEIKTMGSYSYYSVINKSPVDNLNHAYLRKTDGTAGGTSLVYDFSAFTGVPQVVFLTPVNNILYFIVYDAEGTGVDQLWRSDGTAAGTYLVYNFGLTQYVASYLMVAGNNMYVMIVTPGTGNVLWKSDGTAAGTVPVKTIGTSGNNNYPPFTATIGNNLVFAGLDGNGKELWVTDGTAAGTNMVADINPGVGNSNPANFTFLNDFLYFSATSAASGNELWKSDGTASGTVIVKDINPGVGNSNPQQFALSGNTILFNANNGTTGGELWITDGTTANTVQASDMNPGAGGAFPNLLTPGNPVFFAANNGVSGFEVFKYDNTDGIAGLHKLYVNDNSTSGNVFTTVVGDNSNPGTRMAPVATISYAVSIAQPGDTIYVDAGTYIEQVTIDKGITIIGAGQDLTSILKPIVTIDPPPVPPSTFAERGVIQTAQSIVGDVHISNLSVTGDYTVGVTPIIIQSGGSVKNCKLQNGNQGIFVRIDPVINLATKTFVVDGNTINAEFIAVNFAGTSLTATLTNNNIAALHPGFASCVWAGADFGTLAGLTVTGNTFSSFVTDGLYIRTNNGTISQNSFTGTGPKAINKFGGSTITATCNWYGSPLAATVTSKITAGVIYSPWLMNGTDNSIAVGFQTSSTCPTPNSFYVNDNSQLGDIFTTAIGNNGNNGSAAAPFASLNYAISQVAANDIIYVDAGNYAEQVIIDRGITIIGAGQNLCSFTPPATPLIPASGPFTEIGLFETTPGIGNVHISNLTINSNGGSQNIIIQSGGSVSNCKLLNGGQGIFFRVDPSSAPDPGTNSLNRTALIQNNIIEPNGIGINCQGSRLTATISNNTIAKATGYYAGIFAGLDFGPLPQLTISNNIITNYFGIGLEVNSNIGNYNNNSFAGTNGAFAIRKSSGNTPNASCNWYGSPLAANVTASINGAVNFSPWLIDGTDNNPAVGFQTSATCPVANSFYVNDNSTTGDVFTTAIGNNVNPGTIAAPYATLDYAFSQVPAGATIFVDAGFYQTSTDITLNKSITFLGTNYQISPKDPSNPLQSNPARLTESIVVNHSFIIAANDIHIKGFYFDPASKTQIQQTVTTNDFDNIEIEKNQFSITSNTILINITGKQITPLETVNYSINDNRFVKEFGTGGTTISINAIDMVQINNNVFTTNNLYFNNARIQTGIVVGALTGDIVISNNNAYQQNFFINGISAKKTTISFNNADECNRLAFASSSNVNPNEVEITDNIVTNPRTTGGPVISYVRSNGVNLSSPNIARIERNTITLNATGLTNVAQALIAPTLDAASANTQVFIRNNKLTITGDFSTLAAPSAYVYAIRYLTNSRYTLVENNEMEFTATNYNGANKFGIGILHSGLQPGTEFNFLNNKISGFTNSVAFIGSTGFGELPAGVTANINNNSFTGDVMSINNGTVSQSVNASCNWYGSASVQNFFNKITIPTVDFVPWLTNGTDNEPLTTGFQPVPGSCDGYPTLITLDSYTDVTCNGAANGSINITTTYGKAPFVYTWTKEGDAIFVSHDEDPTNLSPGTYHLALVDGNGSNIYITDENADGPGTIDVTITEPTVLNATPSGTNNLCFAESNGTASVLAEGGTAPYTYLWSNGATSSSISNLIAGNYTVTVTDDNGCTAQSNYVVTEPPVLSATATGTSTSCANSATVAALGGTAPYSYLWSNGATAQTISSLLAGTYTVTVTDAHGCTTSASCTVIANEAFNPSATVTDVTCHNGNNGSITITNVNATAPFQFSIDGVNFLPAIPTSTLPYIFSNLAAGTYTIAVRDANGCTGFVTKTVNQPPLLTAILNTVQSTCFGLSTGSISVTVTGGTGALSYSWTSPNGFTSTSKNISNLATGNYSFIVTDNNGCTAVLPVVVVPTFNEITVNATVSDIICKAETNGSISLNVTGGTDNFSYLWSTGATTSIISNLGTGNKSVTITDIGSGCTVSRTFTINQPSQLLKLTIDSAINVRGCTNAEFGKIGVSASGGWGTYQFKFGNGNYQSSGLITGLSAGTYRVYVKDIKGCTVFADVIVGDDGNDAYEGTGGNKNNTKTKAVQIALGANIAARIATIGDPADWYKFTTTAAGNYTVNFTHPSAAFVFNLFTSGSATPIVTQPGSTATAKIYNLNAATTYYISITGGPSYVCYSLSAAPTLASRMNTDLIVKENKLTIDKLNTSVFPNPHRGAFGIKIESVQDGTAIVEIMNSSGQLIGVKRVAVNKGGVSIVNFTNMRHSILFYRVIIGNEVGTGKIIGPN